MDEVEQPRLPELDELDDGLWFIAHAALALAEQEGMGVEGRQDLARQMGQSARLPVDHPHHLRTRHLHSKLPKTRAPDEHTGLATGVYPTDVNAWLEALDAPYRWTPKRWVHQQLEVKQALTAKLGRQPKPPPPETRLKSTLTTSAALDRIAKRKRGDEAVAAELAKGGTPADLANRLQSALDGHQQAKQAAQQFKAQHAGDFAAIQRLQDQLEALPQAERRRVLDAVGLHDVSAAPRPLEPSKPSAPMPSRLPGESPAPSTLSPRAGGQRATPELPSERGERPADVGRESQRVVRHSTDGRRQNLLTPVIRKAEELAGPGASAPAVWVQLQRLASVTPAPPPLIDVVPGGVRYLDDVEEKTLTRKNFGDRMARARRRANTR